MKTKEKESKKNSLNNLTLYLEDLEKEEKTEAKVSRRTKIIKIKAEIE